MSESPAEQDRRKKQENQNYWLNLSDTFKTVDDVLQWEAAPFTLLDYEGYCDVRDKLQKRWKNEEALSYACHLAHLHMVHGHVEAAREMLEKGAALLLPGLALARELKKKLAQLNFITLKRKLVQCKLDAEKFKASASGIFRSNPADNSDGHKKADGSADHKRMQQRNALLLLDQCIQQCTACIENDPRWELVVYKDSLHGLDSVVTRLKPIKRCT